MEVSQQAAQNRTEISTTTDENALESEQVMTPDATSDECRVSKEEQVYECD